MCDKKFALISGAGSGIGLACASALSHSHHILAVGRNEQTAEQIRRACGEDCRIVFMQCDLTKPEDAESRLAELLDRTHCQVEHFVHCAGALSLKPLRVLSAADFTSAFALAATAPALIMKVLMKKRINHQCLKSVVFISSILSGFAAKGYAAYSAAKAAQDGLMRNLALELAPAVRVNSVLPGALHTSQTAQIFENCQQAGVDYYSAYPLGRGSTAAIADAVCFLLSEKSAWITGQTLRVDGGRTILLEDLKFN